MVREGDLDPMGPYIPFKRPRTGRKIHEERDVCGQSRKLREADWRKSGILKGSVEQYQQASKKQKWQISRGLGVGLETIR